MTSGRKAAAAVVAILLLAGCEGVKQDLGIGVKRPPDEFTVYSRAPLSLPPDYGLRPPATATGASQAAQPRDVARNAMLGNAPGSNTAVAASSVSGSSPGLQELLQRTGGTKAQSDIRAQVNRETTILAETSQSFVERLMFWSKTPEEGQVVDAVQENKRIQEAQALNKPISEGDTPTITRRPKALLEGIF